MGNSEPKVWIRKRKTKRGKTYHLRWIDDPLTRAWKSESVGTSHKHALAEKALRERELRDGTYRHIQKTPWQLFADEVVRFLHGCHAGETRRTLAEFEAVCKPASPKVVRHVMIRAYVQHLQDKGNSVATVNKKLRYLRLAFREAVALDYAAVNPMVGWKWQKEPKRTLRILSRDEEPKLLAAAETLYGLQMAVFVRFILETWGRFAEVTKLQWPDVDFDDASVCFRSTKSQEDRYVPLEPHSELLGLLRRLQAKTLQDGGPFIAYRDNRILKNKWARIVEAAGLLPISRHDLRRTGITRALLAGMPVAAVQKIAGHKNLTTTARYYLEVNHDDLRAAVARLSRVASG